MTHPYKDTGGYRPEDIPDADPDGEWDPTKELDPMITGD